VDRGADAAWTASHVIPKGGLPAWATPDGAQAPVSNVDAGLEVDARETYGDWTKVVFSNGWEAWVDGRRLTKIPNTFVIPPGGLAAWSTPDPTQPPASNAQAGLEVELLEANGNWAHVEFTNGWKAWLDRTALVRPQAAATSPWTESTVVMPATAGAPASTGAQISAIWRAPSRITPLPGIGAALIVLGGLLPWLTGGGESVNAWDMPVWDLLSRSPTSNDWRAGWFLLIPLLACIPYLTSKPFPRLATALLASVGTTFGFAGFLLHNDAPGTSLGIGVIMTFLGGIVMAADFVVTARPKS
jgi:SH3-like domain-containing protein